MNTVVNPGKKRTQRAYTMGFKLAVVSEVQKGDLTYKQAQKRYEIQGRSTVLSWLRKHGNLDWNRKMKVKKTISKEEETPSQTLKKLEQELSDENFVLFF